MASTLQGVISQTLVPKVGGGRVAAREILVGTDAVRSLIREGKSAQLLNLMQTGKQFGMTTLEDELLAACSQGLIAADDAVAKANRPDDVRRRLGAAPHAQRLPAASAPRTGSGRTVSSGVAATSAPRPRPTGVVGGARPSGIGAQSPRGR